MTSVTAAFARAMARAAGYEMTAEGDLLSAGEIVRRLPLLEGERLSEEDHLGLIDWIRKTHPDEAALIAAYAQTVVPEDLGVLGLAIKTAPSLRESLRRIARYYKLITDTALYRLDESGALAVFSIENRAAPHPALQLRTECALAGFAANMRRFTGPALRLASVSFRHACRGEPGRYAALFDCPVHFGQARDAILLQRHVLDLPNQLGDSAVCDFLTAHLDTEMAKLCTEASFKEALLLRLSRAFSNGLPQAGSIARAMGMSERTFYRRLADEGLTYRDVLREAQTALAQELLSQSDCTIAEIAFLTGFSEQSTFTRAFKRWVGQPPAQFREQAVHV
ncbi:AraC family transcriptional regulator ligand-binding domain-containing protein [Tepidicaulis sp.]|uniref:AraC family transcriptional regulator n=1 Tax=Tepidicaulis sp. TaxID=1920809 RepID=UPI003B5BA86A